MAIKEIIDTANVYGLDKDICRSCERFSPELIHHVLYGSGTCVHEIRIECGHRDLCEQMVKNLRRGDDHAVD